PARSVAAPARIYGWARMARSVSTRWSAAGRRKEGFSPPAYFPLSAAAAIGGCWPLHTDDLADDEPRGLRVRLDSSGRLSRLPLCHGGQCGWTTRWFRVALRNSIASAPLNDRVTLLLRVSRGARTVVILR